MTTIFSRGKFFSWLITASTALLSACGGGGGSTDSQATSPGITVASVPSDAYKELTPAQVAAASFPSAATVELPSTTNLSIGNVVVVGSKAVKLVTVESGAQPGSVRYGVTTPHLDDVFKSLVLDGSITVDSASVNLASVNHVRPLAASDSVTTAKKSCGYSGSVVNLSGIKCTFDISPTAYPFAQLAGSAAVGGKVELKKWNVINNTGSGRIHLSFDGDIAIQLNGETDSLLPKNDVCSSVRDEVAGTRARLFTLSLPTTIPTVSVRIPFCLAADAKAGITGKLLQFRQQAAFQIAVGDGALPRLANSPPTSSTSEKAAATDVWMIDNLTATESLIPVDAAASVSLAAEIAVEVAAGIPNHPEVTLVDLGLVSTFTGSASAKGKVAPAVLNVGKTIGSLGIDPLYCLEIGVAADFQLTAFASLPAIKLFISGADPTLSKSLFADPIPLWGEKATLGKCDFKAKTQTTVNSTSRPGGVVDFSVTVAKNDTEVGRLWDDRKPSGTVAITNINGAALCTATLAAGQGTCSYAFQAGATDRTEMVLGKYAGDDYFHISDAKNDAVIGANKDCPVVGNKFFGAKVTSSMAVYTGTPSRLVDGIRAAYVNLPAFSGYFDIALSKTGCLSKISVHPSVSPSGLVKYRLTGFDPNLSPVGSFDGEIYMQDNTPVDIYMSAPIFNVSMFRLQVVSSPSWVGWFEVEGY